jgi:RNA polymerase sigma factor (sigma-70 family)
MTIPADAAGVCGRQPNSQLASADEITTAFIGSHGKRLYRLICKQLRGVLDPDECMDVCQETLVKFWEIVDQKLTAGEYDHEHPMRLAVGIASIQIKQARRTALRRAQLAGSPANAETVAHRPDADDSDFRAILLAAYCTLTPFQRQVVDAVLAYSDETGSVRGGRYREIAARLSAPENAVRGAFRRALDKIKRHALTRQACPSW